MVVGNVVGGVCSVAVFGIGALIGGIVYRARSVIEAVSRFRSPSPALSV